jgi:hypothetical protein
MREILPLKSEGAMTWIEGYYCSQCEWEQRFDPKPQHETGSERSRAEEHRCEDHPIRKMRFFQLEHPPSEVVLCDTLACENRADHLDVNEYGHEYRHCAAHTEADSHASLLPKRKVNSALPYRRR